MSMIELAQAQDVGEYQDEQDPEVRGPWEIRDLGSVDWALSRLAECKAEEEEIARQAAQAIRIAAEAITRRAEKLSRQAARGVAYFTMKLAVWAEKNPDMIRQGKKKSRSFIHGSIGTRRKGGRLKVTDKDALVAWLQEQSPERGLFRIKVEPEMDEIQKLYATQGQTPPGCEVDPERDELEIKPINIEKEK